MRVSRRSFLGCVAAAIAGLTLTPVLEWARTPRLTVEMSEDEGKTWVALKSEEFFDAGGGFGVRIEAPLSAKWVWRQYRITRNA